MRTIVPLFALIAIIAIGCGKPAGPQTGGGTAGHDANGKARYTAVCTVGMVADIVREVGGDRVLATNIIGEGVDPHVYTPTSSDVKNLMAADVVFYSGLNLEGKMGATLEKVKAQGKKPVIAVTELIAEEYLLAPPEFAGHHDPHVWMDPNGWRQAVLEVEKALCAYDPDHAADYRANAEAYRLKLDALDAYAKKISLTIPEKSRVLVTAHDAFNYFGRAYGLELLGIQGISTESEPGLDDINRLVDTLIEREIQAVFVESSVPEKNVRALIEGAASRGHTVTVGGELFSDAMGQAGSYEGTYIGMIDHNATTIVRALGGEAPQTGMQGKLTHVK